MPIIDLNKIFVCHFVLAVTCSNNIMQWRFKGTRLFKTNIVYVIHYPDNTSNMTIVSFCTYEIGKNGLDLVKDLATFVNFVSS